MTTSIETRPASSDDAEDLVAMFSEFAASENAQVFVTTDDLLRHIFSDRPVSEIVVATIHQEIVGYALFATVFAPFRGRPGLFLKNVFTKSSHRRRGVGQALMNAVAQIAVERDYVRLEWETLADSEAIEFYSRLGYEAHDIRPFYRLEREAIEALATTNH